MASGKRTISLSTQLTTLRDKIDEVDRKILKLLNERAKLVKRVGKVKNSLQEDASHSSLFYKPDREGVILQKLKEGNPGPFPTDSIEPVFREIISACRSLEVGLRVAYLGPEATFTHRAARQYFGHKATLHPLPAVDEVFDAVERGQYDFGVVPIENSTGGTVGQVLDLFVDTELVISGNIELRISHNLYSKSGQLEKIKKVYSHPQALAQSWGWLKTHLPSVETIETPSTAEAARRASLEDDSAAIAGKEAGVTYGLVPVAERIEDYHNNFTRFLVIGKTKAGRTGKDRTSLLLSLKDEPGILYRALEPFSRAGINMSKIESRPLKRKAWEYLFFIDVDGHIEDPKLKRVLKEVEKTCLFLKVLGSYPL